MTNEQNTAKMLERVRALLAKAEGTEFPEEADAFRSKADELMTRFALDAWMVEQAQAGVNLRPEPIRRDFARSWTDSKFNGDLFAIFAELASHCRCVVGYRGQSYAAMPVYGLPSDLDYLDVLYTHVSLDLAKQLQPAVDPAGELGHEVFKQRQAGIGWADILRKVYNAGLVHPTKAQREKYGLNEDKGGPLGVMGDERPVREALPFEDLRSVVKPSTYGDQAGRFRTGWWRRGELGDLASEIKNRLANANRRYVKDNGLDAERNYVKPEVFQRSFAHGFRMGVEDQLEEMRSARRREAADAGQADSMAVAVRDIRDMAVAVYRNDFPIPEPEPVDPNAKPKKTRAIAVREVVYSTEAMRGGRKAGREAKLSMTPNKGVRASGPALTR